jgi:hypothetical protein
MGELSVVGSTDGTKNLQAGAAVSQLDSAPEGAMSRSAFVVAALIFVGIIVIAGAVLGHIAGEQVADRSDGLATIFGLRVDLGGSALGVALLAATAKDALAVLGNIPDYYEKLKKRAVLQDALKVFVAMFSVMFALHSFAALVESKDESAARVEDLFELRLSIPVGEPPPIAIFPVLFGDDGTLKADENQRADHAHPEKKAWDKGVQAEPRRIAEIVGILSECVDPGRNQSVQVKVFGYSSSKEIKGTALSDPASVETSNETNTRLANKRAQNVHDALRVQLDEARLREDVLLDPAIIWHEYSTMVSARPVMDRISEEKRPDLENWSRRADIHVTRAGKCDRLEILRKTKVIRELPAGLPSAGTAMRLN